MRTTNRRNERIRLGQEVKERKNYGGLETKQNLLL
jgi:hypothetical protein